MILQRWQNLLLFVRLVLMVWSCFMPVASMPDPAASMDTFLFPVDAPVLLVLDIVIAMLLGIAIFMYRNLKSQMSVTTITILLLIAQIITLCVMNLVAMTDAVFNVQAYILPAISLICSYAAYRFERKDWKLLRSYDRLR